MMHESRTIITIIHKVPRVCNIIIMNRKYRSLDRYRKVPSSFLEFEAKTCTDRSFSMCG